MAKSKTIKLNWDFLLDKIKDGQCVLVLGPGVFDEIEYKEDDSISRIRIQQKLLQALQGDEEEINFLKYYPDDDFFLFETPYMRTLTCHQIKKFYKQQPKSETLDKIAEIPFHIILSIMPDKALQGAFENKGLTYQEGYYKKNKEPQLIRKPISSSNPIIYNVFGSVENEESMVLTHGDLYDYFKSIFSKKSMPDKLKIQLREAKSFLFLGVEFDKWYMQLLLRELEIHKEHDFIRFAANQVKNDEISTFCLEQFHINFIDHNITEFIDQLHSKSFDLKMIRTAESLEESEIDRIRKMVGKARFDEAIDTLSELSEDTEIEDDVNMLAGRYRKYNRKVTQGILHVDEKEVESNRITKAILDLANKLEAIL